MADSGNNNKKIVLSANNEPRNVTLNDVAVALGISKATVSLAINGDSRVALKTCEKIFEKVEELGYVYNRSAANLTKGETQTIGLAVHDITNPYFSEVCAAIESVLSRNKRMSFLCNTSESLERQELFIDALVEHRADGLILCPSIGTTVESLKPLIKRSLPTVLIAREVEEADLDYVGNDGFLALEMATEHLIRLGYKKIGMIGGGTATTAHRNRRAGYLSAMERHSLPVKPEWVVDCDSKPNLGEEAVTKLVTEKNLPAAIVCFTDHVALGVMSGLFRLRLQPGRDVAVIGCDDIEEANRGYVQLSTVRIQKVGIGQKAAEILLQRIADPGMATQRVVFRPELVVRQSCAL